jgi:formamidopyrimidine-DNA glycosylase
MPELPEVETIVRGLERRVAGDTITSVWIGSRKQPLKSPAASISRTLEGKQIDRVHRAGKHIVFDLASPNGTTVRSPSRARKDRTRNVAHATNATIGSKGRQVSSETAQWVVHLGMTGNIVIADPSAEVAKHTHLIANLLSGRELRFVDPRMFGRLSVHRGSFDPGGVEPLEVSKEDFVELFRGRKTPIKSALLNQKLLRGVGNIYADESLFRAGIRPRRRASTLTRRELVALYRSVREVWHEAIEAGGSSVSNYVDADGEEGFFQLEHRVYGREGEPCLKCGTPIRRIVLAGRSSHYCPRCQR